MIKLERNEMPVDLEWFKFPGGEVHFKIKQLEVNGLDNLKGYWHIYCDFATSDELILVLLLADYLASEEKYLYMHYTPYARQDRQTNWGEPFSFKTFARLINSCNFNNVYVNTPHSDVTTALLNNCKVMRDDIPTKLVDIIVSPDAGAAKKNERLAFINKLPHVIATKQRDIHTGNITATKVHNDIPLEGKKLLIVDDICDGGRTFIELAKVLRLHNPAEINLHVTVGIFSQGYDTVAQHFDNISTTYRKDINNEI